jgi:hypothetical protein
MPNKASVHSEGLGKPFVTFAYVLGQLGKPSYPCKEILWSPNVVLWPEATPPVRVGAPRKRLIPLETEITDIYVKCHI